MAESREFSPAGSPPERLVAGRYRLLREIGRGGMGTVWLAEDGLLRRWVAVKELRPPQELAGANLQSQQVRALREARSAAGIKHPNAVTLYEVLPATPEDMAVYLIMELVEGHTLDEMIAREGPLPAARVAGYGLQLLDVLEAAHALGIVHRDVKPGNIMLDHNGQVKLTDFGIAHIVGEPRLTSVGVIMGTQAYMAPELFDSAPITPAADLWSLGATLYHAAEGYNLFDRESTGTTLRAILLDDLPVPRCEPTLATAITGLLRRDPRGRAAIGQTRSRLRQVVGQQPLSRQPTEPVREPRPGQTPDAAIGFRSAPPLPDTGVRDARARKHPAPRVSGRHQVAIAGAALLLAAAGVTGGLLAAHPGAGAAASAGATGSRVTGSSGSPGVTSGVLSLRAAIATPAAAAADEIAFNGSGTILALYGATSTSAVTLWDAAHGREIASLPYGSGVSDVAFSPDGQLLAVADRRGGVDLWDVPGRNQLTNLSDPDFATGVAFSSDSGTLAVADQDGIRLWDIASREWIATLPVPGRVSGLRTVMFSGNGKTLAAADSSTGDVYVWDVGSRRLVATVAPPGKDDLPGLGSWISFSSDSATLAIGSLGGLGDFAGVRFWNVYKRAVVATLEHPGAYGVNTVAYSPADQDALAVAGNNGSIYLWQTSTRWKLLASPADPDHTEIADVAFSPDGKTLAALDVNDQIYLWKDADHP
jgi:WD40 repeat protein